MTLVIAEKPGVARAIANVIPGVRERVAGGLKIGDYIITNVFGHLLRLKAPEEYDPNLKKWTLDSLPIFFEDWEKTAITTQSDNTAGKKFETAQERLDLIGNYLKQADCVIHGGDTDDEGQCLIDEVLEHFHYTGKVLRLTTNDTSPEAMRKNLQKLEDNSIYVLNGRAAYARSVADFTVGINLSRFFTLNNPEALLTIGRVQTPTLGLVVERDRLINGHTQIKYYTVKANIGIDDKEFEAKYVPAKNNPNLDENGYITNRNVADDIRKMLLQLPQETGTISQDKKKEQPPLPFNLVKLQVYCEKKWGYSPEKTLNITQSLRDTYNAISYNRSDCQYLTSNQHREAPSVLEHVRQNLGSLPDGIDTSIRSRAFDDSYINGSGAAAHLAIIPIAVTFDASKLTAEERNVYTAICRFYIAQFMPPAIKEETKFESGLSDGGKLTATATKILEPGFRTLFPELTAPTPSQLSDIAPGKYPYIVKGAKLEEGTTKPPAPYTQATLGEDMTRIAKYVEDPVVKQLLLDKDKGKRGENGSIGTEATRAGIISGLIKRGYLIEDGKGKLHATPLGQELCRILPPELVKPDLTARWWTIQEDIKAGKADPKTLTDSVLEMVNKMLQTQYPKVDMTKIPDSLKRSGTSSVPVGVCWRCGKPVIEGKFGFGCSGYKEGCKFVIWKAPKSPMLANVQISKEDARKLLRHDKIHKKSLLKKTGEKFEADLVLEDDPTSPYGPSLTFPKREGVGLCPRCGKPVMEGPKGYGCSGWRSTPPCDFVIWKTTRIGPTKTAPSISFATDDVKKLLTGEVVQKNISDPGTKRKKTVTISLNPANKGGINICC